MNMNSYVPMCPAPRRDKYGFEASLDPLPEIDISNPKSTRSRSPWRAVLALPIFGVTVLSGCGSVRSNSPNDASEIDTPSALATLTVTKEGASGTVTSTPAGIDCGTTCTVQLPRGTMVTLTAALDSGTSFDGWAGPCTGNTTTCSFLLDADTAVTASFGVAMHTVSVVLAGNGTGKVTSSPGGISCPTTCSMMVAEGAQITLTATALDASSQFLGWSDSGCASTSPCTLTVTANATISAAFGQNLTLVVTKSGAGTGTVTSNPAGINCGSDCSEVYAKNSSVTLTASPDVGSTFAGWSGGGCTGTGTCTVMLTAATAVTAAFNVIQQALAVTQSGTGKGTITSNPVGINCGTTCVATFTQGTMVTLTATPDANSTFAGWNSGGCTGTGTCTVALSSAITVGAVFHATSFATSSGWSCGVGVSCQDVYDFRFAASTTVTVSVSNVTASSVLRLGAFGPGTALTDSDLFTGSSFDRQCFGQNVGDTVAFRATTAGTYRIAIGHDGSDSAGASGTYTATVTASAPMSFLGQSVNDAATGAAGKKCGYTFTAASGWNCAAGVNCQDVYDFTTVASTPVTVAATSVTGNSVIRMAVFDGSTLNTTNRLNSNLADRMCGAPNANDSATSASLPTGLHRIAIGRDWNSSLGTGGTYFVTISTTNTPLSPNGLTSNDTASLLSSTTCP